MDNYFSHLSLYQFLNIKKLYNIVPKYNYFGLFITIERGEGGKNDNVHGCIGYWEKNLKKIDNMVLNDKILYCTEQALNHDQRKNNFNLNVYYDNKAKIKVSLMILDSIQKISNEGKIGNSNIIFNNKDWGIMVYNGNIAGATYLPDVFDNMSWDKIRKSINNKANLGVNDNYEYWAYKTNIQIVELNNIFNINPKIIGFLRYPLKWIHAQNVNDILYSINNGNLEYDSNQGVRNISTIYQLIKYGYNNYNTILEKYYNDYITGKNKKLNFDYLSPLPYLILCYNLLKNNKLDGLINDLIENIGNLEKKFQKGQGLKALLLVNKDISRYIKDDIEFIENLKLDKYDINDIFYINWILQWYTIYKNNKLVENIENIKNYLNWFFDNYVKLDNIKTLETNYLAVLFEILAQIYKYNIELENMMSYIFIQLENRKNINGLYQFLDGSIRIDITIHVISGIDFIIN
tara:strand:+ start:1148 stop:2533 length:1386 start_codon:yes stop_codon:yes gene_type:complete